MPETAGQERTEKATPKKREEARKKGQVASSREVSSAVVLLASLGFFYFAGSWMFWNLSEVITQVFQNIGTLRLNNIDDASVFSLEVLTRLLAILIPFLLPLAILGFAANILQVGFKISTEAIASEIEQAKSDLRNKASCVSQITGGTDQVRCKDTVYRHHCLFTIEKRYEGLSVARQPGGRPDPCFHCPGIA